MPKTPQAPSNYNYVALSPAPTPGRNRRTQKTQNNHRAGYDRSTTLSGKSGPPRLTEQTDSKNSGADARDPTIPTGRAPRRLDFRATRKPSHPQAHKPPTDDQHITDLNEHPYADGVQARPQPAPGQKHPAPGEPGRHGRKVPKPTRENEAVALPGPRVAPQRRDLRPHAQPQRAVPGMLHHADEAPQGRATAQREDRAQSRREPEPRVRAPEHVTPEGKKREPPAHAPAHGTTAGGFYAENA